MEIPDSDSRIPESTTFTVFDGDNAFIEVVEPMIQLEDIGEEKLAINHAVPPSLHNLSITVTMEKKLFLDVTYDSLGDEESNTFIEVPMPQIQELFDWLKKNNHIK